MFPVVLFSGPNTNTVRARQLLTQAGFTLGTRHDAHGLPDWPEDADELGAEDDWWAATAAQRRGVTVGWVECVNAEQLPEDDVLHGQLESLGWMLRMHSAEGHAIEPEPAELRVLQLEDRVAALEALLTGATGHPDPGAIQAAAQTPPYAIQASSHGAELFRRATFFDSYPARGGVRQTTDLGVTQNGSPNMSVNVASGEVLIPGTTTAAQGMYYGFNDATVNLAVAASNPTNPRIDLVCATVDDAAYAGGANDWKLQVITGTPAPSPSVPATPTSSLALAQLAIAANATQVLNANITTVALIAGMKPWNLPWGAPTAPIAITTAQTGIGSGGEGDLATVSQLVWTAVANRLYRVSLYLPWTAGAGAPGYAFALVTDASNVHKLSLTATDRAATNDDTFDFCGSYVETPAAGSVTRKVRGSSSALSTTWQTACSSTRPGLFWVEDIGPATRGF